jgi:hypothetical protein
MEKRRKVYKISVGETEGKRPPGRPRLRLKVILKWPSDKYKVID